MFANTISVARKYGAKVVAPAALVLLPFAARAADGDDAAAIVTKVTAAMTSGAGIASAIVLGLFAIWAIKLLWRSK